MVDWYLSHLPLVLGATPDGRRQAGHIAAAFVRGRGRRRRRPGWGADPTRRLKASVTGADKRSEMKAINLLPPDLRGTPKSATPKAAATPEAPGGIGAFVVLGALAACVVALAAYVLTTNTVKDRQAQLEAATAHAEATRQRVDQLKPYADFQAMAETRIQTVKDLAVLALRLGAGAARHLARRPGRRHAHRAERHDLQRRRRRRAACAARSPPRPSSSRAARLGQKQVATLLSRLRNVDGVTRVSLNKSAKPDTQTPNGPAPIADGPGGTAATCSGTRPPEFELVMFFEGAEVPETVEDITVQPGAGGERLRQGRAGSPERRPARTETPATTPDDTATPSRHASREGPPNDPLEQDPAGRGRARRRHRRLLLPRPLAPARGDRPPRHRDRRPGGLGRAGAADGRHLREGEGRLQDATTRRWPASARPSRRTTTSAR